MGGKCGGRGVVHRRDLRPTPPLPPPPQVRSERRRCLPVRSLSIDCCGSFVQFDASSGVFVISRAISQELFLLDETLSTVLFSAHFDTFFRGLVVASSCVFAFTNGGVFSFFVPAVEWLKACPLCLDHFVLARGSGNG